jgi:peroxiredoxin
MEKYGKFTAAHLCKNDDARTGHNDGNRVFGGRGLGLSIVLVLSLMLLGGGCKKGPKVEDFTIPSLESGDCRLSDEQGKVVILTFFTYRCPWCRKQLKEFTKLAKKIDFEKVTIFAVHIRGGVNMSERLRPLKPDKSVRMCMDDGTVAKRFKKGGKLENKYNINGVPHTLVLDQKGRIAKVRRGYTKAGKLHEDISDLL